MQLCIDVLSDLYSHSKKRMEISSVDALMTPKQQLQKKFSMRGAEDEADVFTFRFQKWFFDKRIHKT